MSVCFTVFQAKVNGFTSDKMKDSQTLISAEQIEMDALEITVEPSAKVCACPVRIRPA